MPFFDLPDFNCMRFILLLFANLTYEFILSVQRVADPQILPSYRRCKSFVLTLPSVAILHTVCPERSMAHGTQTSSRDSPAYQWFSRSVLFSNHTFLLLNSLRKLKMSTSIEDALKPIVKCVSSTRLRYVPLE